MTVLKDRDGSIFFEKNRTVPNNSAITLMELLVALGLLSMIVLAISSIDTFSRFHTFSSERRAEVQNEASIALEHMNKHMMMAIGEKNDYPVNADNISGDTAIKVRVDDGDGQLNSDDYWIAYRYKDGSASSEERYQLWYYAKCVGDKCKKKDGSTDPEIIARKVSAFSFTTSTTDSYITVQITTCWDPSETCGTSENPSVNMQTRIHLPSVSIN